MFEPIQELIEQTAAKLHRSIAVDDSELALLGSSTHFEEVDEARLSSLVGRKITGPLRDYIMDQGAKNWRQVTFVSARPDIGIERDRLCFPLRSRYELLGFMWIIGKDLDEESLAIAAEAAERIGQALARRAQSQVDSERESESLISDLLSAHALERLQAARFMRERKILVGFEEYVVLVVAMKADLRSSLGEPPEDIVRRAVAAAKTGRWQDACAFTPGASQSTIVLGSRTSTSYEAVQSFAHRIHEEVRLLDKKLAAETTIGIGSDQPDLETIAESHAQALVAVKVGRAYHRKITSWSDNPTDVMIGAMVGPSYDDWLIPPALRRLQVSQPESTLQLIETFLDQAGNAIRTAEELNIHRTTVYYRINRFQESTGLDLENGSTRLVLHLWLRSRRFINS
ncbi:PucR family transcriptional regulator [Brevibacterium sp. UCMA 11754]|uniref:PucR family transcriptional regulator n=1 Tax=Brevibacterium sp. UCMA 11754 TaxID=2749198 RepID=UPI001F193BD4|nr:helix-turn-helix domain-containing protein [Brevibacterium sp. UCMA 11754]MCF2573635.1 helix-turn-helix domain-containing protein [Brevibacterium sp. UCMA 11754]